MHLDRLSPRARARWASVLGVAVAGTLAGGSLVALNRDVLPFTGWPSLKGHGDAHQQLPAAPALVRHHAASGGGSPVGRALTTGLVSAAGAPPLAAAARRVSAGGALLDGAASAATGSVV